MSMSKVSSISVERGRCGTNPVLYAGYNKPNGKQVDHRCVVPVYVNTIGRKNKDGVRGEGTTKVYQLTAWGKAALSLCLHVQEGKEISFEADEQQYKTRFMRDGKPILNSDGTEILIDRSSYELRPETILYGESSTKFINEGLANGTIAIGYDGSVPTGMLMAAVAQGFEAVKSLANLAIQGPEREKQMRVAWNAQVFHPGMEKFGYAKVVYKTPVNAYTPPVATAPPAPQAVPTAPPVPPAGITVDGFTREQMLLHGWTDETLLTSHNGHFAALSLLGNNVKQAQAASII